jgi:hypothetical protein
MRKLLMLPLLAAALLLAPGALAATRTVSITNTGFVPNAITIEVDDAITWTNSDNRDRQIAAQDPGFASPILKPKESYSYTFKKEGRFTVSDPLVKAQRLTVTVTKPAPVGSPSLVASRGRLIHGGAVVLSGKVPTSARGESVSLVAEVLTPQGTKQASAVAQTTTGDGGTYSFTATPAAQTTYTVRWQATPATTAASEAVTVKVAPRIGFGVVRKQGRLVTFSAKATSAIGYAGHWVAFQRRNSYGQWVTLKRVVLRSDAVATRATARLPKGLSRVRVLLPKAQAGVGYEAGVSRTMLIVR